MITPRVRIGPSPTGEPHVGTAYIALFNLAFARKHGGTFVLRIEDTDRERSRPEWEARIIQGLRWLGLDWDEGPDVGGPHGPYRQSERSEIYREYAHKLLESGHAYRDFATPEELAAQQAEDKAAKGPKKADKLSRDLPDSVIQAHLDAGKPYTIRMRVPQEGSTEVIDRLRGPVVFPNSEVTDQVLLKSDGYPTYHLASVVDDHLMGITHVIRAEEWISSSPKHVLLYAWFGWEPPEFVHMPLLRNPDGSKISKRKNPVSLDDYRRRGFHPKAVVNYLSTMGFTMPDQREVYDFGEFSQALDLDRIVLGEPKFDLEKFSWLNGKYFREVLDDDAVASFLRDEILSAERIRSLVPLFKERIDLGEQFVPAAEYFFCGDVELDLELLTPKKRELSELKPALEGLIPVLDGFHPYQAGPLEEAVRAYTEQIGWKPRDFFMPLRIALTGRKASPPLFDVMEQLGRPLVRRRLRAAADACTGQ